MEKFGRYNFIILKNEEKKGWSYEILVNGMHGPTVLRKSKELFEYEGIARFAAIGHISLLEQDKG